VRRLLQPPSYPFNVFAIIQSYIDWHSIAPIYVVLGLYGFHLLRRIYECFFVHAFSHRLMPLHNYALSTLPAIFSCHITS
jgi:hypothetical protein